MTAILTRSQTFLGHESLDEFEYRMNGVPYESIKFALNAARKEGIERVVQEWNNKEHDLRPKPAPEPASTSDLDKVCEISDITTKGFYVYKGLPKETEGRRLLYIGTTIQIPADRFRWHKANGKDFRFEIIKICANEDEMLDTEFALIKKYAPKHNKITKRKQNFNKKLSPEEKYSRAGNSEWCQCCLTRRVNKGYEFCYYCSK